MRRGLAVWAALALFLIGLGVGRAADRDEATVAVLVSSTDHEAAEGYFSLGENATVMAKPGTDLYRFLLRQRGRRIKIVLTEDGRPDLSKLVR